MSKHTPGPWKRIANSIKSRKANCVIVRLPALTDCVGDETADQIKEWDANARLIAAAPDLLEALEEAVYMLGIQEINEDSKPYERRIMAALAKAKGETK